MQAVVEKAKEYNVPIRVGVNSGSLEKNLLEKYGGVTAEGIVESALDKVRMIEEMGYDNLVVSIKSSDVLMCVRAHELIAEKCQYPLHVGITESGTVYSGNIKSSVGLGIILHEGIGNTIRVSLTGDPTEEIRFFCFSGAIDHTSHHCHFDIQINVLHHLFYLICKSDQIDPGTSAGRAGNYFDPAFSHSQCF